MFLFTIATLAPLAFLFAGALWGGWWIAGGIFVITVFTWAADHLMRHAAAVTGREDEFPSGDGLAVALAVLLLAGLVLTVRAFGADFSGLELLGLVIGWVLAFGEIGHPVAHELIHRRAAWMRVLAARSMRRC